MEEHKPGFNINKLSLPATIILASFILGGFFYVTQANKQRSIEKQQQLELQAKSEQDRTKAEQDKKEYAADRKSDCLKIYETESEKWNNVRGWRYDETGDQCYIRYKEPVAKTDAKCDELYPTQSDNRFSLTFWRENLLCKEGEFENTF